jgi:hypothetical protein
MHTTDDWSIGSSPLADFLVFCVFSVNCGETLISFGRCAKAVFPSLEQRAEHQSLCRLIMQHDNVLRIMVRAVSEILGRDVEGQNDPGAFLVDMCKFLYQYDETARLRTRAMLCHIYHFALHNKWFDARNLMLMSHLQVRYAIHGLFLANFYGIHSMESISSRTSSIESKSSRNLSHLLNARTQGRKEWSDYSLASHVSFFSLAVF